MGESRGEIVQIDTMTVRQPPGPPFNGFVFKEGEMNGGEIDSNWDFGFHSASLGRISIEDVFHSLLHSGRFREPVRC